MLATPRSAGPTFLTIQMPMQAFIGMGLAIGKTTQKGHADYGTVLGNAHKLDTAHAIWNVFTALGSMAFAYSYVSSHEGLIISIAQHSSIAGRNKVCKSAHQSVWPNVALDKNQLTQSALLLKSCS